MNVMRACEKTGFTVIMILIGLVFASGLGCRKDFSSAEPGKDKGKSSNIVVLVGVQPPRTAVEGLLRLVAQTRPSLAWINPETMTNMALEFITAKVGFMEDLNPEDPLWFGILSGKKGKPSIFALIPLKENTTGSRIVDRFFVKQEEDFGNHRHEKKSKKSIWWKKSNGYLIVSSREEKLPFLETMLARDLAGRIPESVLEAEIRPRAIAESWDIELKEIVSMLAVFSRLAFLSSRSGTGNEILSRLGVLSRSWLDNKMSWYANMSRDVEVVRTRLFFDENGLAFEGVVIPEEGSRLDIALSGARPGRPVGEEVCNETTYFFFARREGWNEIGKRRENLSRSFAYVLKPGFVNRDQERETKEALRRFLEASFGDVTLMFHGVSNGRDAGNFLGGTGVAKFHDAQKVKIAFLELVSLFYKLDWSKLHPPQSLEILHKCVHTVVREREKDQYSIHEIEFVYDGVSCPGPLPVVLTAIFGKPVLETAIVVRGMDILWALGAGAGERLAHLLDKPVVMKCDLMEIVDKAPATWWLAFSLGSFMKRTNLFGISNVLDDAAGGLEGGGGVVFTRGTRERTGKGESSGIGKEAFIRFHVDRGEIHDILYLLISSKSIPDILKRTSP